MLCFCFSGYGSDNLLIRKLYLDVLKVPPMPSELEYYDTEFLDSYKAAVDEIIKPNNPKYHNFLSEEYKKNKISLTFSERANIIYYYVGFKHSNTLDPITLKNAIMKLIEFSNIECDTLTEKFDYFSIRMMGRRLTAAECNDLLKIYNDLNKSKSEDDSLYFIFLDIMNFNDSNYR